MYRVRSTDLWYNAPGVVAAYQPVAAPDAFAARQNVSNDGRMAGRHTAIPGVTPTWASATGWTFNGTTQYLNSGVIPQRGMTALVAFTQASVSKTYQLLFGSYGVPGARFVIGNKYSSKYPYFSYGNDITPPLTGQFTSGVLGLAGGACYVDGAFVTTGGSWSATATVPIYLGSHNPPNFTLVAASTQQAVCISMATMSAAHVAQYSRQMAYCHVNPDWSAWGRRRQYYYAPSEVAAAGSVGIYGRRGSVALPGGVRIEAVR